MKLFRKILFWTHLVAGLAAGLVIAVLCFTGVAMSFENQIVAWDQRDVRRIPVPAADAQIHKIDELITFVRDEYPEARPTGVTVSSDPRDATIIAAGRGQNFYVDPYTTAIHEGRSPRLAEFFAAMLRWHRFLTFSGLERGVAEQVIGVATFIFLGLSLTGLYLWWPRQWNWRTLKTISLFNWKLSGKARDWNWHNVIGLWTTPVIIVICVTGLMITYRWVSNLAYVITGEPIPPTPQRGPATAGATPAQQTPAPATEGRTQTAQLDTLPAPAPGQANTVVVPTPPRGARPLGYDALLASVQKEYPNWSRITLRSAQQARGGAGGQQRGPGGPGGGAPAPRAAEGNAPANTPPSTVTADTATAPSSTPASETPPAARRTEGGGAARAPRAIQPMTASVRTDDMWLSTSNITLSLDPYTGNILQKRSMSDQPVARQARMLAVPLHTGVIAGWPTQLLVALAALGGLFLVYTGFALSWRRFFKRKPAVKTVSAPAAASPVAPGQRATATARQTS